jgi:hypothetical protein
MKEFELDAGGEGGLRMRRFCKKKRKIIKRRQNWRLKLNCQDC